MKLKPVIILLTLLFPMAIHAQTAESGTQAKSKSQSNREQLIQKLYVEPDGRNAELIAADILKKIDTDTAWASEKSKRDIYRVTPLYAYLEAEDFDGFKRYLAKLGEVTGTERIHFATAAYARRLVRKGIDLDFASQLIQKERTWAKQKMLQAADESEGRRFAYAMFTADYAALLSKKGQKAKALDLYKEAMTYNTQRKEADLTNAYLELAAEMVSKAQLKAEMETLVKNGMATARIIDKMKTLYVEEKGSEAGFDSYLASFNGDKLQEKINSLQKEMLNEQAPDFHLKDLNGKSVSLAGLRGKTVVLDFWATWCGPCKAAFPAMQTMVNKYKNDPEVQFLFIDTYERGDTKEKNARDYMTQMKYTFQVLMDNTDEVAKKYKAKNIPAKFVIDKNGMLRFRAAGFKSDADLMEEIEAMIKLANEG